MVSMSNNNLAVKRAMKRQRPESEDEGEDCLQFRPSSINDECHSAQEDHVTPRVSE